MFSFLTLKHKLIALAAVLAMIPIAYGVGYLRGYWAGEESVEVRTAKQVVHISEVKNEIRNNRPDDDGLIDSLRNGHF